MIRVKQLGKGTEELDDSRHIALSVQDVANTVPSESKEETEVLRSLEEQAKPRSKSLSEGILQGVPDEASHVFTERDSTITQSAPTPESVEEELHDLVGEFGGSSISGSTTNIKSKKSMVAGKFNSDAEKLIGKAKKLSKDIDAKETYTDFKRYLRGQKTTIWQYIKRALIVMAVATGIAAFLFYVLDNPGGEQEEDASTSWWFIFLFVRQVCTWSLAMATEALLIDFLCLRRPILLRLLGPYLTLLLVQSKGWPFHLVFFSLYDYALLYGDRDIARHWLYYQSFFKMFSKANPAGTVTESNTYGNLLNFAILAGLLIALKKFFMGLWYGRAVYEKYGKELTKIMKQSLLIKRLAKQAKSPNKQMTQTNLDLFHFSQLGGKFEDDKEGDQEEEVETEDLLIQTDRRNLFGDSLASSQQLRIKNLLGEWEEPVIDERKVENVGISAIVQFRTAVSVIDNQYPFSSLFGLADKREHCIDSAQKLYLRLKDSDADVLTFDRIAVIAVKDNQELDEALVKSLIKLFRPTREGELNMLDFVKSIDNVYKDLRLMQASILNMQKMNAAFQKLWDFLFGFLLLWIFLLAIGVDTVALMSSVIAIIVGFSFMVGGALSKAFEGLLFVLNRKPYDVGDRIAVSGVDEKANGGGSSGWVVKDLNLYTTTLVFGTTGEEATFTNGYLNAYRIINMNRSPKAMLNFVMKFGIDVTREKIVAYGKGVEAFVKERPREWLSFAAYRLTNVAPEKGYVEYIVVLQHRESWQQIGALLTSKADVQNFAFDLSKKLGMGYQSPPMPIILGKDGGDDSSGSSDMLGELLSKKDA